MRATTVAVLICVSTMLYCASAHAARINLGVGLGSPYGLIGISPEVVLGDRVALFGGLGSSRGVIGTSCGTRFYFGQPSSRYRIRLGALYGTVLIALPLKVGAVEYPAEGHNGIFASLGVRWRISQNMSFDLDIGQIIPSENTITKVASDGGTNHIYTLTTQDSTKIALGLSYHFQAR